MTVTIAGETRFLSAGDSYFVPRGVSHRIRNEGAVPMRSLQIATPGEFADFVMAAGMKRSDFDKLDPSAPPPLEYMTRIAELADKFGIEILEPPAM